MRDHRPHACVPKDHFFLIFFFFTTCGEVWVTSQNSMLHLPSCLRKTLSYVTITIMHEKKNNYKIKREL
ncbi:hypothetical protein JHK87_041646 [Glycine soja]|nr:hypothetical protein JHK87_041646 [Glycine soja]